MSALRASADHVRVLASEARRTRERLLDAWRDPHAQAFDQDVLHPLDRETARLERSLDAADREVDAALRALRHLGAHI